MPNEQLNKFQSAVTRTTAAIGVKTSVFVGSAKLKTHISTLKRDITAMESELGTTVYRLWEKGENDPEQVTAQCKAIKEKYDNIEALQIEINKLETQESEVLGSKKQEGVVSAAARPDAIICANCGTSYDLPVKFCRKCGTKMA